MKLIQLKTAISHIRDDIREAVELAESLETDEGAIEGLPELTDNLRKLADLCDGAIPEAVRMATAREIRRLTEPRFGWCGECGAEWGYAVSSPRDPAGRCSDCRAPETARVPEKPTNPPRKDFRKNPLMDFLE